MSLSLTLLIVFGVVFAAALFAGFLYEKELKEFERILVRYLKLRAKARKSGLSVEDYVKAKKMQKVYDKMLPHITDDDPVLLLPSPVEPEPEIATALSPEK